MYPRLSRLIDIQSRYKVEEDTPNLAILPGACFVDMQKLVKALMETDPGHTVPQSAKIMHMQTETKACAGDDSL